MRGLLVFRERVKAFYAKNSTLVTALLKFAASFTAIFLINRNAGFIPKFSGMPVTAMFGLVSTVLPWGVITFLVGSFLLIQLYGASLEVAVITFVFMLIVVFLYYGFQPGDSVVLLMTPVLLFMKMPFAIPLLIGLTGSLISVIPMSCGIFVYYVIVYVKQNSSFLAGSGQTEMTEVFAQVVKSLLGNQTLVIMIAACCLGALVVCVVKKLSVNYSWGIAIMAGIIAQLSVVFVGDFVFGVTFSMSELILNILLSAGVALVYHFFAFTVDYSRTEYVQFEDDDYYYYVKAVPKIAISKTDVKVQKINKINKKVSRPQKAAKHE